MKTAPRLRFGPSVRIPSLFVGFFVIGFAIVCLLKSRLGLSPWDVLHQGIARHSPLTIGTASIVVALVVLLFSWALGQPPGWGTLANAIVIGVAVDCSGIEPSAAASSPGASDAAGRRRRGAFGIGTAMYIMLADTSGLADASGARRTGATAVVRFSMEAAVS
jgi:hypothetical protein